MKHIIKKTAVIVGMIAMSANANATEVFADSTVTTGLSTVSVEAVENLKACLEADTVNVSSRALRACTKAYRESVPSYELRSEILTRRGVMQLSKSRFDKAARDFSLASDLSADKDLANLGQGFAALLQEDADAAIQRFQDCSNSGHAAHLAAYGLALALEAKGDRKGAIAAYERALSLKPGWQTARENLRNLRLAT